MPGAWKTGVEKVTVISKLYRCSAPPQKSTREQYLEANVSRSFRTGAQNEVRALQLVVQLQYLAHLECLELAALVRNNQNDGCHVSFGSGR